MLFMCQGKQKPGLSIADRQKVLQIVAAWTPPAGLEIKAHYLGASGGDFVVVETTSVEALLEATAIYAPFIDYEVTPIVAAPDGIAALKRTESVRQTLL